MVKPNLRKFYIEKRASFSDEYRKSAEKGIFENFKQIEITPDKKIALYNALNDEVQMDYLLGYLLENNFTCMLPCIVSKGEALIFRGYKKDTKLVKGFHDIYEPAEDSPILTPDIIFVPTLTFDDHGSRLGYGGGFYDRTIESLNKQGENPILISVCYDKLKHDGDLPKEAHDVLINYVVTEERVFSY